jgi:AmmeMemoRadiSam system protein B
VDQASDASAFARRVRTPAVAGILYPADAMELSRTVGTLLALAPPAERRAPKALIVPHGGLRHSGRIAAHAFRTLDADRLTRVVLAGPVHRQLVEGIVLPDADAFASPLGTVPVDVAGSAALLSLPWVRRAEQPHRREHGLEVQLPFLQLVLKRFTLLPMLVGRASAELVATALRRVWGGPETLVIVTTDLSQHRPYGDAQQRDRSTAERILQCQPGLGPDCACAGALVDALLLVAREHGLSPATLALANSGDTGGDVRRVVGYGAFGFY